MECGNYVIRHVRPFLFLRVRISGAQLITVSKLSINPSPGQSAVAGAR